RRALDRLDVRRGRALGAVRGVIADFGAFGERLEAAAGDARVVHEQVLALVVGRDEPEALFVAEPLDGSSSHQNSSQEVVCCETREVLSNYFGTQGTASTGPTPGTMSRILADSIAGRRHVCESRRMQGLLRRWPWLVAAGVVLVAVVVLKLEDGASAPTPG